MANALLIPRPVGGELQLPIEQVRASSYTIPTESKESDGTLEWDATTLVVAEISAAGKTGIGYSYVDASAANFIRRFLAPILTGEDAMAVTRVWHTMRQKARNQGRSSIVAMAISAVDCALWDLKARVLGLPLSILLGPVRPSVPVYGSGGFTSFSIPELEQQLGDWAAAGIRRVKMKVGREPAADRGRVEAARHAIGAEVGLFVDANGAYGRKQAEAMAAEFEKCGVSWFEEPVSAYDFEGLRMVRDHAPAGMEIAAGEYGYEVEYFHRLLESKSVDVLQADVTRSSGVTGFLAVAALCDAYHVPLSSHCAPALHLHLGCAIPALRHLEYFSDHVRLERMLFDGTPALRNGQLYPDLSRPGHGLELKHADAERFSV